MKASSAELQKDDIWIRMRSTYVLMAMFVDEAWKLRVELMDLLLLMLLMRDRRAGVERERGRMLCMMRGIFVKVGQSVSWVMDGS
jgi:hypothetical protein